MSGQPLLEVSETAVDSRCLRRVRQFFLALSCWFLASGEKTRDCCRMRATSEAVIFSDALLWVVLWQEGLMIPNPPRRTLAAP